MRRWRRSWLLALAAVLGGGGLLLWSQGVTAQVRASLLACLQGLVPSLFPFLVLASFLARSPAGDVLGRLLTPLLRWGFRLPACCGGTVLLGLLGGYPAGARGISLLLAQGRLTQSQAARALGFCVNPGAAFLVTYVGGGLLGDASLGWALFFSVTGSSLLLGVLSGLGQPLPPREAPPPPPAQGAAPLFQAVRDASAALVSLGGWVLLFGAASPLLQRAGLWDLAAGLLGAGGLLSPRDAQSVLGFLWEVTAGAGTAAQVGASGPVFAFGLAFGGLCVHLQILSLFSPFPGRLGRFFLFRLLHGLGAAGLFLLLRPLFWGEGATAVWASLGGGAPQAEAFSATWLGGLSLVLLCGAFLLLTGREREKEDCAAGGDVLQ